MRLFVSRVMILAKGNPRFWSGASIGAYSRMKFRDLLRDVPALALGSSRLTDKKPEAMKPAGRGNLNPLTWYLTNTAFNTSPQPYIIIHYR